MPGLSVVGEVARELDFQLFELLEAEQLSGLPHFAEHSADTFRAALASAEQIARERFEPMHRAADLQEPAIVDGQVQLPDGSGAALRAFAEAGFIAAAEDEALGGMQLPFCVAMGCWGLFKAANIALEAYATLTAGVARLIQHHGTAAQKARYVPPLLGGRWFGTMVLTEPQAGSSLADLRSTAQPAGEGAYRLRGHKIFITAGDHELAENIVHLVLARLPGAPAGVRGLSLFIVPKWRSDGTRNDVALQGLIHKLGFRGTTSALLAFGEQGECTAELIGKPHEGLACFFDMMNEARIGVGLGSALLALAAQRHALAYARERRQGRPPGAAPHSAPVPIAEHADVKRLLLAQKARAEGGVALALYAARLHDLQQHAVAAVQRQQAAQELALLTPIVKAWCSQAGIAANDMAIQVLGGYGYTRDFAPEQFWRDNRLNALHEGTNGIQALDLLGRKVLGSEGAGFERLAQAVRQTVAQARVQPEAGLAPQAGQLEEAWAALARTTQVLGALLAREPQRALALATPYLEVFGDTLVAWTWLAQGLMAAAALPLQADDAAAGYYRGKLAAARHWFAWELPVAQLRHDALRAPAFDWNEVDAAWL